MSLFQISLYNVTICVLIIVITTMSSLLRNYTSTTAVLTALDSAECAMSDSQVLETSIANVAASQDRGQVILVIAKDLRDDKEGVSL